MFIYFFEKIGFNISFMLSSKETFHMNVKANFLEKKKIKFINWRSAKFS